MCVQMSTLDWSPASACVERGRAIQAWGHLVPDCTVFCKGCHVIKYIGGFWEEVWGGGGSGGRLASLECFSVTSRGLSMLFPEWGDLAPVSPFFLVKILLLVQPYSWMNSGCRKSSLPARQATSWGRGHDLNHECSLFPHPHPCPELQRLKG